MKINDIEFVTHTETGTICRVVHWDVVEKSFVLAAVCNESGIWRDVDLAFAKKAEFTDLQDDDLKRFGELYLLNELEDK